MIYLAVQEGEIEVYQLSSRVFPSVRGHDQFQFMIPMILMMMMIMMRMISLEQLGVRVFVLLQKKMNAEGVQEHLALALAVEVVHQPHSVDPLLGDLFLGAVQFVGQLLFWDVEAVLLMQMILCEVLWIIFSSENAVLSKKLLNKQ